MTVVAVALVLYRWGVVSGQRTAYLCEYMSPQSAVSSEAYIPLATKQVS